MLGRFSACRTQKRARTQRVPIDRIHTLCAVCSSCPRASSTSRLPRRSTTTASTTRRSRSTSRASATSRQRSNVRLCNCAVWPSHTTTSCSFARSGRLSNCHSFPRHTLDADEKQPKFKEAIKGNMLKYIERAEKLRKAKEAPPKPEKKAAASGGGGGECVGYPARPSRQGSVCRARWTNSSSRPPCAGAVARRVLTAGFRAQQGQRRRRRRQDERQTGR